MDKLTDPQLLAKVAQEADYAGGVRAAALKGLADHLTDQILVSRLALEAKDAGVRMTAVAKLTDQSSLARIAMEDEDAQVRLYAVHNLTDQMLISRVLEKAQDAALRRATLKKLTDQALLSKFIGQNIKRITGQIGKEPISFGPTETVTFNNRGQTVNMRSNPARAVGPNNDQSFLIVQIGFLPTTPFELDASDVRLVVSDSQTGSQEAFAIRTGEFWADPNTLNLITVSNERSFSWAFKIASGSSDSRQYKISFLGAEFRLGDK
jgi:hypothetical protein